jgi:hypothetical protein
MSPGKIAKRHNSHQAFLAIQYRQTMYLLIAQLFAAAFMVRSSKTYVMGMT